MPLLGAGHPANPLNRARLHYEALQAMPIEPSTIIPINQWRPMCLLATKANTTSVLRLHTQTMEDLGMVQRQSDGGVKVLADGLRILDAATV